MCVCVCVCVSVCVCVCVFHNLVSSPVWWVAGTNKYRYIWIFLFP